VLSSRSCSAHSSLFSGVAEGASGAGQPLKTD